MGAGASSAAVQLAEALGCAAVRVDYTPYDPEFAALPPRAHGERSGWAGGLPDAALARVFDYAEKGATVLGSRPRAAPGGAASQARDCGASVCAAGTLRLVCRAWRRVHDARVHALRPRALHPLQLPAAFPNLRSLNLSRIAFPPLPALAALLPRLPQLTSLAMRDNGAGHMAAATIATALCQRACRLSTVNLGENHIDDRGAASLADALRDSRSLTELQLRDNGITDVGAIALANALDPRWAPLSALDLSANAGITAHSAPHFAHALSASPPPPLAALALGGCALGDAGARVLADALPSAPLLRALALYGNGIGDAGAAALAGALRRGSRLEALSLFGNAVACPGAAAFADALPAAKALKSLDLFDNDVDFAGASALATAIAALPAEAQLRELRLTLARPRFADDVAEELRARAGPRLATAGVCGRARAPQPWRPHAAGLVAEDGPMAAA